MSRFTDEESMARIDRLINGGAQFGHAGRHHGNGTPDCPRELHHHHDIFCTPPTDKELRLAGMTRDQVRSRG